MGSPVNLCGSYKDLEAKKAETLQVMNQAIKIAIFFKISGFFFLHKLKLEVQPNDYNFAKLKTSTDTSALRN